MESARLKPKTVSERVAKHRKRVRERDLQVALAVSRIVEGADPGDARNALAAYLKQVAGRADIPEDYRDIIEAAVLKLGRRRR